jgi:hypothetical protein
MPQPGPESAGTQLRVGVDGADKVRNHRGRDQGPVRLAARLSYHRS